MAEAYAIQAEISRVRHARGERLLGYKLGCTSKAVQDQLGVQQPIFGPVFESGCFATGAPISASHYTNLAVEGELALRLKADLHSDSLTDERLAEAIGAVFPVIELHHFVLPAHVPRTPALAATGGMHAGLVLPETELPAWLSHQAPCMLSVCISGRRASTTTEPWTMGSATASLRWLASRLAECGLCLRRGQLILTGSPLPMFPVGAGETIVVEASPLGACCAEIVP